MCSCCVSACGREISCRWGSVGVGGSLEVWRSLMAPPQTHSICLRIPLRTHTHRLSFGGVGRCSEARRMVTPARALFVSPGVCFKGWWDTGGWRICHILFSSFPPALALMCVDVVQRNRPALFRVLSSSNLLSLSFFLSEVCVGDYSVDLSGFAFSTRCHCFWFRHIFY